MRFKPYASGSGGNLAEVESATGARLLLDCGLGPKDLALALRHQTAQYDGCLLSHHHGDHAAGAAAVLRAGVPLYASPECLAELRLANHHRACAVPPKVAQRIPCGGSGREGEEWRVLAFALPHDAPGNYGYLVEHGGERMLYACDTSSIPYRFKGLNLLAIEVNYSEAILLASDVPVEQRLRTLRTHHSLERALRWLQELDLRRCEEIWLLHLSGAHSNAETFRAAVMETTGVPCYVAPA